MTHITRITSNIKAGVDAKLTPKTLITGGAGRGKSSIVEALAFATNNGPPWPGCQAEATTSDGGKYVTRDSDSAMRSFKEPKDGGSAIMPFGGIVACFEDGAAVARNLLLSVIDAEVGRDALSAVPAGLRERMKEALAHGTHGGTFVDKLGSVAKYAKWARGEAERKLAALPAAPDVAKRPLPSLAQLADVAANDWARHLAARDAFGRNERASAALIALGEIERRHGAALGGLLEAEIQLARAIGATPDEVSELAAAVAEKESVYEEEQAALAQGRACVLMDAEVRELPSDTQATLNDALERFQVARADAVWALRAEAISGEATRLHRDITDWELLRDSCEHALSRFLDGHLEKFVADVQRFLPPDDTVDIQLRDELRFGLVRDGKLHDSLSGAERTRVLAAIAAATVKGDGLAILAIDEPLGDPDTLASVLKALSSVPAQVVVCSLVVPREVPEGWTHLNLDPPPEPVKPPPEPDFFESIPGVVGAEAK